MGHVPDDNASCGMFIRGLFQLSGFLFGDANHLVLFVLLERGTHPSLLRLRQELTPNELEPCLINRWGGLPKVSDIRVTIVHVYLSGLGVSEISVESYLDLIENFKCHG